MRYLLGVDAGGTKTHALIADESGQALGFGTGGRGNPQRLGFDGQRTALEEATLTALAMARLGIHDVAAAGFGLAGFDWPSQSQQHMESVRSLGLACPFEIVNDSIIGLLAGTSEGWGVALVAGTGNNCRGRDRNGREGRITGDGVLFGEHGGGTELVEKAVEAVAYEWSRRGPATALTEKLLHLTGARNLDELIEGFDLGRYVPTGSWARAVFEVAQSGDEVARRVIEWMARELGESAAAVIRQLDLEDDEVEVIQIGGLFDGGALFTQPLAETVRASAPHAKFVRLEVPPVIGSIMLAMQKIGIDSASAKHKLIESTKAIVQRPGVQI